MYSIIIICKRRWSFNTDRIHILFYFLFTDLIILFTQKILYGEVTSPRQGQLQEGENNPKMFLGFNLLTLQRSKLVLALHYTITIAQWVIQNTLLIIQQFSFFRRKYRKYVIFLYDTSNHFKFAECWEGYSLFSFLVFEKKLVS